jgi:hypothetical protein
VHQRRAGLAESDDRVRSAKLEDAWSIVNQRGKQIRVAMERFRQRFVDESPSRGTFAIHALGGTGRQKICASSNVDIGHRREPLLIAHSS